MHKDAALLWELAQVANADVSGDKAEAIERRAQAASALFLEIVRRHFGAKTEILHLRLGGSGFVLELRTGSGKTIVQGVAAPRLDAARAEAAAIAARLVEARAVRVLASEGAPT